MNYYTLASKLRKDIKQAINELVHNEDVDQQQWKNTVYKRKLNEFRETASLGIDLMLEFRAIAAEKGLYIEKVKNMYFITIRPDETRCTFEEFYNYIYHFMTRSCFIKYTLSFEQKGCNMEDLGKGFHVHIIAEMTQRSKGEVIRDTYSSLHIICDKNCIQVDKLTTTKDVEQATKYITDYESKDNHKIETKSWDDLWRKKTGLKSNYDKVPATIKSDVAGIEFTS